MPATLSYPGVYIEEIPSGVRTITGVSTSVAAFLGRASKGPLDKAVRLLSLSDFERNFGEPESRSELASAVRLFFQNGGSECYVGRLVKKGTAATSSITLKNEAGTPVLKFSAKEPGVTGNELALQIKYNASNPEGAFDLTVSRIASGIVRATESHPNLSMDKAHARYAPMFVTQHSMLVDCELSLSDASYALAAAGYSQSRRPIPADDKSTLEGALSGLWSGAAKSFRLSVDGSPPVDVDLSGVTVSDTTVVLVVAKAKTNIKTAINAVLPAGLLV